MLHPHPVLRKCDIGTRSSSALELRGWHHRSDTEASRTPSGHHSPAAPVPNIGRSLSPASQCRVTEIPSVSPVDNSHQQRHHSETPRTRGVGQPVQELLAPIPLFEGEPDRCRAAKRRASKKHNEQEPLQRCTKRTHSDDSHPVWYCRQHEDAPEGRVDFDTVTGSAVLFDDWIPPYVSAGTRQMLRILMTEPDQTKGYVDLFRTLLRRLPKPFASKTKVPLYIYTFKVQGATNDEDSNVFKIGLSSRPGQRLNQWNWKCKPVKYEPLGEWPVRDSHTKVTRVGGLLEKLVHYTIADLVIHKQHHHPNFPNVTWNEIQDASSLPLPLVVDVLEVSHHRRNKERVPCQGSSCSAKHKEIFPLPTIGTRFEGREYQEIIRPVIKKWGRFCSTHVPIAKNRNRNDRGLFWPTVVLVIFLVFLVSRYMRFT